MGEKIMQIISSASDVLVMLISLANLVYLVWVRKEDKKEREELQKSTELAQKKYIWYKEIIISPGIEIIDQFFDECEHLIDQINKDNVPDMIVKLRNNMQRIRWMLPPSMKVIDQGWARKCRLELEKCEDIVTNYADKVKQGMAAHSYETKRDLKSEHDTIISLLYEKGFQL